MSFTRFLEADKKLSKGSKTQKWDREGPGRLLSQRVSRKMSRADEG